MKFASKIKTTGEQNRQRILDCITISMPYGKTTAELIQETNLDRDTIYSHCKEMMDKEIIVKHGKFGTYKVTDRLYKNPLYVAQSLLKEVFQKPYYRTQYLALNEEFTSDKLFKELDRLSDQDPDFFKNAKNRAKMDTILIYEFANRIGAIITYLIIYPFQFSRRSLNTLGNLGIGNQMRNQHQQQKIVDGNLMDNIITGWISKAVQPVMILNEFIRFMNYARGRIYGEDILRLTKKLDKNDSSSWSFYEIESRENQRLVDAIATAYPEIFQIMENISKKELPKKIDTRLEQHNRQMKYLSCRSHLFKTEIIENIQYYTCSRCGVRHKVKLSNIVTNPELISKLDKESKVIMKGIKRKKCRVHDHIWIRSSAPDPTKNIFECICCSRQLMLDGESKKKLDKINELIPLRFSAENDRNLCKLVQSFFYDQSNVEHSFSNLYDYIRDYYNKHLDLISSRKRSDYDIHDTSTITKKLQSVIKFLVDLDFLSLGTSRSTKNDPGLSYLHRNLTSWR